MSCEHKVKEEVLHRARGRKKKKTERDERVLDEKEGEMNQK